MTWSSHDDSHPLKKWSLRETRGGSEEYPEWAWRRFLNSEARKNDKAKHKAFIAETLSRLPPERLASIIHPSSEWLSRTSVDLQKVCLEPFERVVQALIEALKKNPDAGTSGLVRSGKGRDWATEALNAPTGKIAQAFLNDLRTQDLKQEQGFPKDRIHHVEGLLGLAGDLKRFPLVIFTHNLNWFYFIDPDWTDSNLISVLRSEDRYDTEAWWSGYLWGARYFPGDKLFQFLKTHLLDKAASDGHEDEDHNDRLAGLILAGWNYGESGERLISNKEFRRVLLNGGDRFRSRILWNLETFLTRQDRDDKHWDEMLHEFVSDVWPVQKEVKTASSSASLVRLAFSDSARFSQISGAILPLLTKIDRDRPLMLDFRQSNDTISEIIGLHPAHALSVLYAVLPDNAAAWPYEMAATLDRIGSATPALKKDKRLIDLKRRWNSR